MSNIDYLVGKLNDLPYDLMKNIITRGPPPSLKYITLTRIAVILWQIKLKYRYLELVDYELFVNKLKCFAIDIIEEVSNLVIPIHCKNDLEPLIKSIGLEISNFFHQIKPPNLTRLCVLEIYWSHICFTQQGTINSLETAVRIINNTNLKVIMEMINSNGIKSQDELQCYQSLLAKLLYLHEKFSMDFSMSESMDYVIVQNHQLAFLIYYDKREIDMFFRILREEESCENLLLWSVYDNKEAAVQHLWMNYANTEIKESVLGIVLLGGSSNPNLSLYFCTKVSEDQLKDANTKMHNCLIKKIHLVSRWCDILSAKRYVHEIIQIKNSLQSFEIIIQSWIMDYLNFTEFSEEVFNEFIENVKLDLENHILGFIDAYSSPPLDPIKYIAILLTLLKNSTSAKTKNDLTFLIKEHKRRLMV